MYCTKCGGTGIDVEGNTCSCQSSRNKIRQILDSETVGIPKRYLGVQQDIEMSSNRKLTERLITLSNDIVSGKADGRNYLVSAEPKSGVSIFVYDTIQQLYIKGYNIPRYVDILEIDMNDKEYLTSPYVFIKIPTELSFKCFDNLVTLLDRRSRNDTLVTVMTSYFPYSYLSKADTKGIFAKYKGDGNFGTYDEIS